jgi:diketogulonate reductase-like aldo/keto reductase
MAASYHLLYLQSLTASKGNPALNELAEKYGKSVAQMSIRYCLQRETLPLPKSTHHEYIAENADVDFDIAAEDMATLDAFTT